MRREVVQEILSHLTKLGVPFGDEEIISAAYSKGVADSADALQDEYCNHDDPMIGIVRGLAAIRKLGVNP